MRLHHSQLYGWGIRHFLFGLKTDIVGSLDIKKDFLEKCKDPMPESSVVAYCCTPPLTIAYSTFFLPFYAHGEAFLIINIDIVY